MRRWRTERGTALVEAAITIPILLLIAAQPHSMPIEIQEN